MALSSAKHLFAAGLADDHPVGAHAQRPAHQLGQADPALALQVRLAGLQRHHVGVELGEAVQAQLEGVLDGDEPLRWWDVRRHGAQQGRLARPVPPQMMHDLRANMAARTNSRSADVEGAHGRPGRRG